MSPKVTPDRRKGPGVLAEPESDSQRPRVSEISQEEDGLVKLPKNKGRMRK